MKIFRRREQDVLLPSLNWPSAFETFLERKGLCAEREFVHHAEKEQLIQIPHGRNGAWVVCTRDSPLSGSWRVAAFHSNLLAELNAFDPANLAKADGLVVRGECFQSPLAISTADCLAVAMTLEQSDKIQLAACFHAGWRGYTQGIQQNTLKWMISQLGAAETASAGWIDNLHVTIGPAIAGSSYPCGPDVAHALSDHLSLRLRTLKGWNLEHEEAFRGSLQPESLEKRQSEKIFPDLQVLMAIELSALGVPMGQVSLLREDTFTSPWWPSHRRAMAAGLPSAGRMMTHLCPVACP